MEEEKDEGLRENTHTKKTKTGNTKDYTKELRKTWPLGNSTSRK